MKHLLQLSLLILLSFASFNPSYAVQSESDDVEIDLKEDRPPTRPRSIVVPAKAWYNSETSTLRLRLTSQDGLAIVTVKDIMGCEVCSQSVLANGTMQQISLPNYYETDIYTVQIEYGGTTCTGQFGAN